MGKQNTYHRAMLTYQSHLCFLPFLSSLPAVIDIGWQVINAETSWDSGHFKEAEILGHHSGECWLRHCQISSCRDGNKGNSHGGTDSRFQFCVDVRGRHICGERGGAGGWLLFLNSSCDFLVFSF